MNFVSLRSAAARPICAAVRQASSKASSSAVATSHSDPADDLRLYDPGRSLFQLPPMDGKVYLTPIPTPQRTGIDYYNHRRAEEHHGREAGELWRKISYYVALPFCVILGVDIGLDEYNHIMHKKHEWEEKDGDEDEEEAIRYPYMDNRRVSFPWGQQSFFYNKYFNHEVAEQ